MNKVHTREGINKILYFPWYVYAQNVSKYLDELENDGEYALSANSGPTLMATAMAVLLQKALQIPINVDAVERIESAWDEQRKRFFCSALERDLPCNVAYIRNQTSYFSRLALRAVGIESSKHRACRSTSKHEIEAWLGCRDWDHPWDASNEIMFVLEDLLNPPASDEDIDAGVHLLITLLKYRNHMTGMWGSGQSSTLSQMCASMHFVPFYLDLGLEFGADRIRHGAVNALGSGGCFYPLVGGGACPDYDGTCILVWLRGSDVADELLLPIFSNHLLNQRQGLFIEASRFEGQLPEAGVLESSVVEWSMMKTHLYSGWAAMRYHVDKPNVWACWVRAASLAMIQRVYGIPSEYVFTSHPGIGWMHKE